MHDICIFFALSLSLIVIVCVFLRICPAAFQLLFVTKVFSVFFFLMCAHLWSLFFDVADISRMYAFCVNVQKSTHIGMNEMVRRPVRIICTSFHCCYDYLRLLNGCACVLVYCGI